MKNHCEDDREKLLGRSPGKMTGKQAWGKRLGRKAKKMTEKIDWEE